MATLCNALLCNAFNHSPTKGVGICKRPINHNPGHRYTYADVVPVKAVSAATALLEAQSKFDGLKQAVEKLIEEYGTDWCEDGKEAVHDALKPFGVEGTQDFNAVTVTLKLSLPESVIFISRYRNVELTRDFMASLERVLCTEILVDGMILPISKVAVTNDIDVWSDSDYDFYS